MVGRPIAKWSGTGRQANVRTATASSGEQVIAVMAKYAADFDRIALCKPVGAGSISPRELDVLATAAADSIGARKSAISIKLLSSPKKVVDDIPKYLIGDSGSSSRWVLRMSPIAFPERAAETQGRALQAADALDDELSSAVVRPHAVGRVADGRTYATVPYCTPIDGRGVANFVSRKVLFPKVIHWLRLLTQRTARKASPEELENRFIGPIESMLRLNWVPADLAKVGDVALRRIRQGDWRPSVVFFHGDLWSGNVLRRIDGRRHGDSPFKEIAIIDWDGFLEDGYAFFDLVRFGPCVGKSWVSWKREVKRHAAILGCSLEDIELYNAAAHSAIAVDLQEFPKDQFNSMFRRSIGTLRSLKLTRS